MTFFVRPPVHRRALQRDFKAAEPKVRSCFMLTVLVLAFILGAAMGQAREKTQTGGVVMSYRYEDGSLQTLLEERPELLG